MLIKPVGRLCKFSGTLYHGIVNTVHPMRNPYLSMLGTAWKYARNQRKLFLLVYGMFLVANIIVALNPLFYGWFINALQRDSTDVLTNGWIYVGGFLLLRLLEW